MTENFEWWGEVKARREVKHVKPEPGNPVDVTFQRREPAKKFFKSDEDSNNPYYEWDVLLHKNGEVKTKILQVSALLLQEQLMELDQKRSLLGRRFIISASGEGYQRRYSLTEVV